MIITKGKKIKAMIKHLLISIFVFISFLGSAQDEGVRLIKANEAHQALVLQLDVTVNAFCDKTSFSKEILDRASKKVVGRSYEDLFMKNPNNDMNYLGLNVQNSDENSINILINENGSRNNSRVISYSCVEFIGENISILSKKLTKTMLNERSMEDFESGTNALMVSKEYFAKKEKILTKPALDVLYETPSYKVFSVNRNVYWGKVEVYTESMVEADYKSVWVGKPIVTIGNYFNRLGSQYLCRGQEEIILGHSNYASFDNVEFKFKKSDIESNTMINKGMKLMVSKSVNYLDLKYRAQNAFGWSDWQETTFTVLDNCEALLKSDISFKVYPNPTSDYLYIEPEDKDVEAFSIEFYNQHGNFVQRNTINKGSSIDVSSFETGNYFLKIFTDGRFAEYQVIIN